ncbi:MAG: type II secretion system F family protein [Veillonellaceae bacterium]|jgi:tight adherence protein C|nr:type II secretion system F family protein [Veillonellaceae bacterium]
MLIAITLLTFTMFFILSYLALNAFLPVRDPVEMRLKALENYGGSRTDIDHELDKPFKERILAPLTSNLASAVDRLAPASVKKVVADRLAMAGGFAGLGVEEFLLFCIILAVALSSVVCSLAMVLQTPAGKTFALAIIFGLIGLIAPFVLLSRNIAQRKLSIQRDLPDVLDLLTVSVEAGLSFDGALAKLSEKMKGALVDEFTRLLQEIRMGIPRREALTAMGLRCDVPDVSLFTTSLVQADQLGVGIGNVLRVQSASMREKRQQRCEEKAMKAPIKMMLPLVLFIFPTIFIVLLGPAIIQIMAVLMDR